MPLQLQPLELSDFDTLISHASTHAPGDDLVAPLNPLVWPVRTRAEAQARARHNFALQKWRFVEDPTTRFLKVVDPEDGGQIVAVARWHFYPQGYDYAEQAHWEMAPATPLKKYLAAVNGREQPGEGSSEADVESDMQEDVYPPPNFNIALHNHILASRDAFRPSWIPGRAPCWVLMHLVTRSSQRRRGAAGLLVRWGMDRAQETGACAYLEAGVQGRPVYEKFGFEQIGEERRVSFARFVGEDGPREIVMANMRWNPEVQEDTPSESI
ncbi:hypothetical protein JX265_013721 [Neoarthrinium moseri]|uniref:N-acetyltransferase domain-containing protein n=1 Tax=Neoarthrinium moseri TaxID=1658444 RepID=A0A9Q0AIB1_9PEZI|nr:hypothetical protein JX265_013721 [Neoarthrinium moseri]